MEKYYESKYTSGRGNYFNIYDEDFKLVRWEKAQRDKLGHDIAPEGLLQIVGAHSPVEAFLETERLNEQFCLVVGRRKMSREQREKFTRNAIK